MRKLPKELAKEIRDLELVIVHRVVANLEVQPVILDDIRNTQKVDEYLAKVQKFDEDTKNKEFIVLSNGTVRFKGKFYMPEATELIEQLLKEAHEIPYSTYLGPTKMHQDLKKGY